MINLYSPIKDLIFSLLDCDRSAMKLFMEGESLSNLFSDLIKMGCDFFELLRIFCLKDSACFLIGKEIKVLFPYQKNICNFDEKYIRRIIPHWTASKYHTASIDMVIHKIFNHITHKDLGTYIYHSNHNPQNAKAADDIYVLFVLEDGSTFIDLNRKEIYFFQGEYHG